MSRLEASFRTLTISVASGHTKLASTVLRSQRALAHIAKVEEHHARITAIIAGFISFFACANHKYCAANGNVDDLTPPTLPLIFSSI